MNTNSFNLSSFLSDDFINTLFDKCVNQISGVTEICFLLCGLFALGYFANILLKTWAKGKAIDFNSLLRPFVIGIICLNFSWVYGLVDDIFNPINEYTATIANTESPEMTENRNRLTQVKKEFIAAENAAKSEDGFWKGVFSVNSISGFFDNLYMNVMDLLLNGLQYIAGIAFGAVKLIIRAISISFRIVLIVFGPFAFALSVLPIFKDNWKSWLSKYINVCLFIPIANLMDVIVAQLHNTLNSQHIDIYSQAIKMLDKDVSQVDSLLTTITISYIIFMVAFIILYLMIPSIASYIVSASGMENLTGGITLAGSAAASKLISGTSPNPLIPNILQLFRRHPWKQCIREWINPGASLVHNNTVVSQS